MPSLRTLALDLLALSIGFVLAATSPTLLAATRSSFGGSLVPTVWLLSPNDGQALSGSVIVSATASQDTDILQFEISSGSLGPAITSGACSMNWNTAAVNDGTYTLDVVAYDATGNSASSPPVTVSVENNAAQISNVATTGITMTSATITWTTNQLSSSGVDYGISGYSNSTPIDLTLVTQHAETLVGLTPGTLYHFRVSSWNGVGLLATSADFIFSTDLDSSSPTQTPMPAACTTPDPFVALGGGTCVNGGWLPPAMMLTPSPNPKPTPTPTPGPGGCKTPDPFAALGGGTCVNGGWLPPTETPAPLPSPVPEPTPTPIPPTPGQCATPDPFAAKGGGTCVNGGWYPPGMLTIIGSQQTSSPTSMSAPTGCSTPDPFVAIGGGTCLDGGWVPHNVAMPPASPTSTLSSAPAPSPAPPGPDGCLTGDPFVSLGGGTCLKGAWYPPGMLPAPGTVNPVAAPSSPSMPVACATPDPFASMSGLQGLCINGGWYPVRKGG